MNPRLCTLSKTVLGMLLAAAPALAIAAGSVMFVAGDVRVIGPDGAARMAVKGTPVKPGDRIVTPSGASVQVKMQDGAVVAVRPASQLVFEPAGPNDTKPLTLISGAVRVAAVDTNANDKAGYEIKTPNASFKLHKSDQETLFVRPEAPEADGGKQAGTFQKIHYGKGEMKAGDKTVTLERKDIGFVPINAKEGAKLDKLPPAVEKAHGNALLARIDAGKTPKRPGPAGEPVKPGLVKQPSAPLPDIARLKPGAGGLKPEVVTAAPPNAKVGPLLGATQPAAMMKSFTNLSAPIAAIAKPPATAPTIQPALTLKQAAPSGAGAAPGLTEFQIVKTKAQPVAPTQKILVPTTRIK